MKKRILSIVGVLVLLAVLVAPMGVWAATDTISGSFQTSNNAPSATVTVYATDGTTNVTSMTPGTAYDVKVNVTDVDGLSNLNTITLKLWYDANGGTPIRSEFNAITAGNAQTAIIITWTDSGTFVLTEESGSSWELGTGVVPGSLPGDFEFEFTVGKVAKATTVSDCWQIAALVVDDSAGESFACDTETNTMNWYGEIAVAGTTVNWGTVSAGMAFAEGDSSEENVGNITYISNGSYNKKVSTTATWSTTATLDATGACSSANQFALKADDSGTLPADSNLVTTGGVTIGTGTITGEAGSTDATNGLWLKLAAIFAGGTFTGTITYTISN
jgi:hypothetical protein